MNTLVVSRDVGKTIVIGKKIHITIINVDDSTVKLGITCPSHIPIDSEESIERRALSRRRISRDSGSAQATGVAELHNRGEPLAYLASGCDDGINGWNG